MTFPKKTSFNGLSENVGQFSTKLNKKNLRNNDKSSMLEVEVILAENMFHEGTQA